MCGAQLDQYWTAEAVWALMKEKDFACLHLAPRGLVPVRFVAKLCPEERLVAIFVCHSVVGSETKFELLSRLRRRVGQGRIFWPCQVSVAFGMPLLRYTYPLLWEMVAWRQLRVQQVEQDIVKGACQLTRKELLPGVFSKTWAAIRSSLPFSPPVLIGSGCTGKVDLWIRVVGYRHYTSMLSILGGGRRHWNKTE